MGQLTTMADNELLAGTRNAYVHLYEDDEHGHILSIDGTEYAVGDEFAERFQRDNVDGETIRKREEAGDW